MAATDTALDRAAAWPPVLVVAFAPLLVRSVEIAGVGVAGFDDLRHQVDTFHWLKAQLVTGCGSLALAALGALAWRRLRARRAPSVPPRDPGRLQAPRALRVPLLALTLYLALLWLSTAFAASFGTALFGAPQQSEGALVLTAYAALALLAARAAAAHAWIANAVTRAALVGAAVVWALGIAEFFEVSPLRWEPLLRLVRGRFAGAAFAPWGEPGTISSTLGHGNYVGSHAALLLPLALAVALGSEKRGARIAGACVVVLGCAVLYGSQSRGGMIAAAAGVSVVGVLMRARLRRGAPLLLVTAAAAAVAVLAMAPFASAQLQRKNALASEIAGDIRSDRSALPLEVLTVAGNAAHVRYGGEDLRIYAAGEQLLLTDGDGRPLMHRMEGERLRLLDERYRDIELLPGTAPSGRVLLLRFPRGEVPLLLAPDSIRVAAPGGGAETEAPALAFAASKWDLMLSSRGFIWNRTLPLLHELLLLGAGPGAFGAEFPQRDFAGKVNAYGRHNVYVDKPHNLYLQIAHASGVASAGALAVLWAWCLLRARRATGIAAGLAAGCAAYLVAGLVNDGSVGVAPVFWVLLGCGVGLTGPGLTSMSLAGPERRG